MSIERAIINRARPEILRSKIEAIVQSEVAKGCQPNLSHIPVSLEPHFRLISNFREVFLEDSKPEAIRQSSGTSEAPFRREIWISPEQQFDWNRSELFLKQIASVGNRVGLEIVGNQEQMIMALVCCPADSPIVSAAFQGQFSRCQLIGPCRDFLSTLPTDAWQNDVFYDGFPSPPYSQLFTRPEELHVSPYETLFTILADLPPPAIGLFQALFQPAAPMHNWHQNVQVLHDLEFTIKLLDGVGFSNSYTQQPPSSSLHQMARHVEEKAHNDKPFYFLALRLAVMGAGHAGASWLQALSTFMNLFQHGGRPLNHLTDQDYASLFSAEQVRDMFVQCRTYRPGFLINSWELTGPVHIPATSILDNRSIPLRILETLPVRDDQFSQGTPVGTCSIAGKEIPVCIPPRPRMRHTHLIGRPDMGKSTTIEAMILSDINDKAGVALFDFHGDLVERLLCLLEESVIDRVIYLDFSDPDWVPIWNPLRTTRGQDAGRTADELVRAFKSVVTGWGDRLENLLRHAFYALLHLPGSTFFDVANLLRPKSNESSQLRKAIIQVIENQDARQFWKHDFGKYRNEEFTPPRHKLSKLLVSETVSLMLSQPDSAFKFRDCMDQSMILLVNLSRIGPEVGNILGSFQLCLMHLSALSRCDTKIEERQPFHIYCDEAHHILTDAFESMIAETRKYGVSLTLSHQFMNQFDHRKADALSSVGTTIIFNVDTKDAYHLSKDLCELVEVNDLINLKLGQAIIRCGTEIIRINTPKPLEIKAVNHRERIIDESRRRYYKSAKQVRRMIDRRWELGNHPVTPPPVPGVVLEGLPREFHYDEF